MNSVLNLKSHMVYLDCESGRKKKYTGVRAFMYEYDSCPLRTIELQCTSITDTTDKDGKFVWFAAKESYMHYLYIVKGDKGIKWSEGLTYLITYDHCEVRVKKTGKIKRYILIKRIQESKLSDIEITTPQDIDHTIVQSAISKICNSKDMSSAKPKTKTTYRRNNTP